MLETLPGEIVGASAEAEDIRRFVDAAARSTEPVLLTGEAGTGKKTVARLIHEGSTRTSAPFLMVDCSLFYERELKRELFGYATGGGSHGKSRKGLLEFASRGTCYLSRVEELSPALQLALLELLRTGRFSRLGDGKSISSNVRVLVSSTKNLQGFVEAGLFDRELFDLLSRLRLRIAPLRERRQDIPAIVDSLGTVRSPAAAAPARLSLTTEALQALQAYPWPGNLEELQKELERLLTQQASSIAPENLSLEISSYWLGQRGDPEVRKVIEELDGYIREFRVLSRLDLSYGELVKAVGSGPVSFGAGSSRDLSEEL